MWDSILIRSHSRNIFIRTRKSKLTIHQNKVIWCKKMYFWYVVRKYFTLWTARCFKKHFCCIFCRILGIELFSFSCLWNVLFTHVSGLFSRKKNKKKKQWTKTPIGLVFLNFIHFNAGSKVISDLWSEENAYTIKCQGSTSGGLIFRSAIYPILLLFLCWHTFFATSWASHKPSPPPYATDVKIDLLPFLSCGWNRNILWGGRWQ